MTEATSKILSRAAAYMSEQGFTKGAFRDEDGRLCMMGAIAQAVGGLVQDTSITVNAGCYEANTVLANVIRQECQEAPEKQLYSSTTIADYNDDPRTTKEDAVLMLKRAAER